MPCGTKYIGMATAGSVGQAPPSEPMGTRDIDLDAAADRGLALARHDLRRRHVGGFEARGAEAVDLHARHGLGVARDDGRGAGDVRALLADRHDAAQHDVVDQVGVELVAVAQRLQGGHGQPHRGHFVQRAILAALAARGADGVVDECVGHGVSPGLCDPMSVTEERPRAARSQPERDPSLRSRMTAGGIRCVVVPKASVRSVPS